MKRRYRLTAVLLALLLPLQGMAAWSTVSGMSAAGCRMMMTGMAPSASTASASAISASKEKMAHHQPHHQSGAMSSMANLQAAAANPAMSAMTHASDSASDSTAPASADCCPADAASHSLHPCEISAACGLLMPVMVSLNDLHFTAPTVRVEPMLLLIHSPPFQPADAIWRPPSYS